MLVLYKFFVLWLRVFIPFGSRPTRLCLAFFLFFLTSAWTVQIGKWTVFLVWTVIPKLFFYYFQFSIFSKIRSIQTHTLVVCTFPLLFPGTWPLHFLCPFLYRTAGPELYTFFFQINICFLSLSVNK